MSLTDSLLRFLKKKPSTENPGAPEGICPNCWGTQEYGNQFYQAIKNENVDVNHPSAKKGWIQDYADKHLAGIQLAHEDDKLVCQKCKIVYKPT